MNSRAAPAPGSFRVTEQRCGACSVMQPLQCSVLLCFVLTGDKAFCWSSQILWKIGLQESLPLQTDWQWKHCIELSPACNLTASGALKESSFQIIHLTIFPCILLLFGLFQPADLMGEEVCICVSWNCFQLVLSPSGYYHDYFYILVQYCEFRWLSLYHKDSLSALFLASERENSPKTSTCCCPTFCAVIVGIKIKSFANEVKVLQCFTPSQFNFHSHLLCCFFQHLQLLSVEQTPAVAWGVLSLAVCMAEYFSSSVASSTVSCSTCSAFSKLVPAVSCFAQPGVWNIQSWTTSLMLARVSWSGMFSSSHTLPAWDSKSKALLPLIYPSIPAGPAKKCCCLWCWYLVVELATT